ncbi:hypothetical protein B6D60_04600 [candidate division KSB1 bacterium 4484_87]|nr:MAG: hypothetical protein B6D60_04600 [candidate division KSB1 bacterium 4484_87]
MKKENKKHSLLRPKKSLGQNFLIDENIARKIVAALEITPSDAVLEIGPGRGVLTKYLVESAGKLLAVEIDRALVAQLSERFGEAENFRLLNEDVLKLDLTSVLNSRHRWKVIGNVPYHITSQIFFKLFEHREKISTAVFMIQREVADRMAAAPNCKDYGILAVFCQFYAEVEKLFHVSRHVFAPKPDVTSAVIRLKMRQHLPIAGTELKIFTEIVKRGFGQRRKMLRNSLQKTTDLSVDWDKIDFNFERRPEQLRVEEFVALAQQIAQKQIRS